MKNPAHTDSSASYYNLLKTPVLPLIPDGPNVILDVGCGAGVTGKKLLSLGKASRVIGVEIFPPAAEEAAQHYAHVHCGDVERLALEYREEFDFVLFNDVLEHLVDPYSIVRQAHTWLKPGGQAICVLPNVRYWQVLVRLVFCGRWEYREAGILDQTHLRFFTRRTAVKLLTDAGFDVIHWHMLIYGKKKGAANAITAGLLREFLGPQILLCGRKGQ